MRVKRYDPIRVFGHGDGALPLYCAHMTKHQMQTQIGKPAAKAMKRLWLWIAGDAASRPARYQLNPDMRTDSDASATTVLDIGHGRLFRLNETGSRIWCGLAAQESLDSIVDDLSARYRLPPSILAEHVFAYVDSLCELGLCARSRM